MSCWGSVGTHVLLCWQLIHVVAIGLVLSDVSCLVERVSAYFCCNVWECSVPSLCNISILTKKMSIYLNEHE